MTLNTSLIEKESRRLYLRTLKDPRIPDDLCSEIYLDFLKRIKRERTKNQGRITGGGIGQLIKLAVKTVFHNKKQQEKREEVLVQLVKPHHSAIWNRSKTDEEKAFFAKVALFLREWAGQKKNHPAYLHHFLLYHAYHLPPEFTESLTGTANVDDQTLREQQETVRENLAARANRQLDRKLTTLGTQYFHIMKRQVDLGGLRIVQHDSSDEEIQRVKANRQKALEAIKTLKFIPTWKTLEELTGASQQMARYGCRAVEKAIRESFRDDTFFG